jgi:hypothetical protein
LGIRLFLFPFLRLPADLLWIIVHMLVRGR